MFHCQKECTVDDEGGEDFSQYGEEELAARLLQLQSELQEEYSKQGSY
jgi:hypothetical protein